MRRKKSLFSGIIYTMTFFFRRLSISCEIIAFSLVLYVTRKGSLRGASLRNSRFSPCLTMSRMCLPEVIHFQISRKFFMLARKLSALLIDVFITFFNFISISLTWFSNFCTGTSVCVPVVVFSGRMFLLKFFSRSAWIFLSCFLGFY